MLPAVKASIAIAAELRSRIARGTLAPGDPLPVEGELVAELGCSKPVVREALRILETEGLVEVRRGIGGGPRVRPPSISHAASTMAVHLQVGDVAVMDVWAARDRIVAGALERLARSRGEADLGPLAEAVEVLAAAVGDLPVFNGQMLEVGTVAVASAGSATEHLLVSALRHIVEVEVAAASGKVEGTDQIGVAVEAETAIVASWQLVLRHLRAGRPAAARAAYEEQADVLRAIIGEDVGDLSVGEALGERPAG
jgi:DNA-binding FadR family transcriptional regulator